jgi:hypothetical protein
VYFILLLPNKKHLLLKMSRDEEISKQHLKQEINLCNKVGNVAKAKKKKKKKETKNPPA